MGIDRRAVLTGIAALGAVGISRAVLPASNRPRTALVIGSGIAGLSAAHDLSKAGFATTVFEKWEFIGGRMRDAWMGPIWGPPHALGVLQANRDMFALGAELGITDQLNGDVGSDEYPVDNGVSLYPTGLRFHVDEVKRIPGLSEQTRQRLPLLQPDLDRIAQEVDPCLMATGASEDDESLGDYYDRMLGKKASREVQDYWIDVVLAAWGWPAYSTSKMALLPWLAQQKSRVVTPKGGIGVLTSKLGTVLNVQTKTTVRFVTPPGRDGRHSVHYLDENLQPRIVTPDVVVCATEGKYIPSLVQGLTAEQSAFFRGIDFTKGGGVQYVLKDRIAPAIPFGSAYTPSHPDPIKRRVGNWSVSPADLSQKGRPAVASINLSRNEVLEWQRSGKGIIEYCFPLMQHFYPGLNDSDVADTVTTMCDDLIYVPVGYIKKAALILAEQERTRRRLYFAGEYLAGAHTGAACASGRRTAKTIIKHWL